MRALKVLTLAALVAAAVATPRPREMQLATQTAAQKTTEMFARTPGLIAEQMSAVHQTTRHMEKLRQSTRAAARGFTAKQAATCDQAGFAEATARVLQACPSLSGLVSGATALEEFLPGFCGSECYTALAEELVAHSACVDDTTAFLLEFVYTCQTTPQCFSETFVVSSVRVEAQCGAQTAATLDITNFTSAGVADATAFCSGTCKTDLLAIYQGYPECLGAGAANAQATIGAVNQLCSTESGELCAVRLKTFGALQCDNAAVCAGSSLCGTGCAPALTIANLDKVCGTCMTGLIPYLTAFGEDPTSFALGLQLYCMKATTGPASETNPYCYGPVVGAFASLSADSSSVTAAATCSATGVKACFPKVIAAVKASSLVSARATFNSCARFATGATTQSACVRVLETSLVAADVIGKTGEIFCAQNAASVYCFDNVVPLFGATVACSSGCSTTGCLSQAVAEQAVADSGCCLPVMNKYVRALLHSSFMGTTPPDVPDMLFPTGTRTASVRAAGSVNATTLFTYTHTSLYARTMLTRGDQPLNAMIGCAGNASAMWATAEGACPTTLASPPTATVPVTLSWQAVNSDAGLKARLEASLRDDIAANAGVGSEQVVNGTLVQGRSTVALRASSRRQTSRGANCDYEFAIDSATAAEADAAVANVNTAVSGGVLLTPATSATVSECTDCMDANQESLVNAAAPAPGAAPPATASSASGVASAAAFAVAAAMLVL